ncbi:thiamine pyrophosphate-dependent enzyme [Pseudophaeobacter sp.]|uniref:thiamine pyrophosphate-dependent enzyme n=1 Tax=Pseudophaeobacter sp. TaxID=1971739 RepID=UPI003299C738
MQKGLPSRLGPNGHQAIAAALKSGGVTHVYSLPGNPIYATLGACAEAGLTVIGCRSQFGALSAAMAQNFQAGALRAVALCSPTPGVTNSITSLSDAKYNHWPMVLIAGVIEEPEIPEAQVLGDQAQISAGFQSFDGAQAAAPCCKAVVKLQDRTALSAGISAALEQAQTVPRGPVFVEVGARVLNARHATQAPAPQKQAPARPLADPQQLDCAQRPVLILGENLRWLSALTPDQTMHLQSVLEQLQLPVLATDMGRGIVPDLHRLSVFMAQEEALQNCDHLLLCGAALDWRFGARSFLDPKVSIEQVPVCFEHLLRLLEAANPQPGRAQWADDLTQAHARGLAKLRQQATKGSEAWRMNALCEALGRWLPETAMTILDSGLALSSGHKLWPVQQPFARMTAGQNGTMGLGIPFALGAAVREQDQPHAERRPVVALVGDVGFALSASELETAQRQGARMIIIVADNGGINGRGFQDQWLPTGSPDIIRYGTQVDYAQVARGWGVRGVTAASGKALHLALSEALVAEGPTVISVPLAQFCEASKPVTDRGADGS